MNKLKNMCGGASGTIFLVTTMWDNPLMKQSVKLDIEEEIKKDWRSAMAQGAQYRCFHNDDASSAQSIIRELLAVKPVVNTTGPVTNTARPAATPVEEVVHKKTFLCF